MAYMTVTELRHVRTVAIEAGDAGRAYSAEHYILAYERACEDYAELYDEEIYSVCPGCNVLLGERDDSIGYAGWRWCPDCAEIYQVTD
jgi:hypothetical protein